MAAAPDPGKRRGEEALGSGTLYHVHPCPSFWLGPEFLLGKAVPPPSKGNNVRQGVTTSRTTSLRLLGRGLQYDTVFGPRGAGGGGQGGRYPNNACRSMEERNRSTCSVTDAFWLVVDYWDSGCFLRLFFGNFKIEAHGGNRFRTPCPIVVRSRSKC